jgi:hypothetical protein
MKKYSIHVATLLLCFLMTKGLVYGQTEEHKNGFAINQNLHDFNISLLDKKVASFDSSLSQSFRVSYWRYLSRSFTFNTGLSNGFLFYQKENDLLINKSYFIGIDAVMQYNIGNGKFISTNARLKPFVSFGYSLNYINRQKEFGNSPWGVSIQWGAGVQLKLSERMSLRLESAMDQEIGKSFDTHMQHRLGFIQTVGKPKEEKPAEKDSIPDYDEDGIADVDDTCPTIPGLIDNHGCPEDYVSAEQEKEFIDSLSNTIASIMEEMTELKDSLEYMNEHPIVIVQNQDKPKQGDVQPDNPDGGVQTPIVNIDPKKGGKDNSDNTKTGSTNEKVYADAGYTDTDHPGIILYEEPIVKSKTASGQNTKGGASKSPQDNSNPNKRINKGTGNGTGSSGTGSAKTKSIASTNAPKASQKAEDYSYPPLHNERSYAKAYPQNTDNKSEMGYYVVAISTLNPKFAQRTAEVLRKTYPIVEVIQTKNGFFRVGIYATRTKSEANKILLYAHEHGLPYAWISKQDLVFN